MIRHILLKFLRDPLFHFLILGAGLFMVFSLVNSSVSVPAEQIVIDETQALRLAEQFQRTWMRPPTRLELQGLAEDFVKEEILYREARALGLDQDDLVIRRRMRQKMEFLNADLAEREQPTDADLRTFMEVRPEMFRSPGRVSLRQIYLDPDGPDGPVAERARDVLKRLSADPEGGTSADAEGDPTLLPRELNAATEAGVARIFGDAFAAALADAPVGRWFGPVESGYGVHLVRVSAREPGRLPALDEVRPAVEREWSAARRAEADSRFYEALRARYAVEIEMPPDKPAEDPDGKRKP
jgi:hypothetical protein